VQAARQGVPPGAYLRVSVGDTGVGMPAAVLGKVFEPFFTTKPIGQGTGLGLSMVYGFAGQSGGFAAIDSQVGHGTTVNVFLPGSDAAIDAVVSPSSALKLGAGAGGTILLVEDQPAVLAMLESVLEEAGYQVRTAVNGIEAQALIKSEGKFDLLISDVGLPGMNGRQLAEVARGVLPQLPVLFMTGYAELATASGHMEHGMDMIAKPFSLEAMLARVRHMLEGS